jgi:hypothetical protein
MQIIEDIYVYGRRVAGSAIAVSEFVKAAGEAVL